MDKIKHQRQQVRYFWSMYGKEMMKIQSIDHVYNHFLKYIEKYDKSVKPEPINRYIFRTMIRKLGYNKKQKQQEAGPTADGNAIAVMQ